MNTYRKGLRLENKVKELYEKQGFVVHRAKISRFNKNDFFGCFDLVCVRKNTANVWVQVKSTYMPKQEMERLKVFCNEHFDCHVNVGAVYVYKDRKWKVWLLNGELWDVGPISEDNVPTRLIASNKSIFKAKLKESEERMRGVVLKYVT